MPLSFNDASIIPPISIAHVEIGTSIHTGEAVLSTIYASFSRDTPKRSANGRNTGPKIRQLAESEKNRISPVTQALICTLTRLPIKWETFFASDSILPDSSIKEMNTPIAVISTKSSAFQGAETCLKIKVCHISTSAEYKLPFVKIKTPTKILVNNDTTVSFVLNAKKIARSGGTTEINP